MSELSPGARRLLDGSRHAGGPSAAQRAAMKQVVLGAALLPGTAMAGVGGVKAVGLGWVAKLGIVVGLGAAVMLSIAKMNAEPVESRQRPRLSTALEMNGDRPALEAAPALPSEPARAKPEPVHPESSRGTGQARQKPRLVEMNGGRPSPQEAPATPPPPPPAADEATLAREVAALSGAMSAVDAKHCDVALDQLTGYRAAFPAGALSTEAGVVEVLALCGMGRVDDARIAAASLPPNNPAVRRLERSCIAKGEPGQ